MNSAPEAAFFAIVAVLTALSLWRELPLQYVATIAVVMYGIVAVVFWLVREPYWWMPLIVLNSRGVSRLILWKSRGREYYGWWLMGLTSVLSTALAPHWGTPALAIVMQLAAMPWLIKRRPTNEAPGYFPLVNCVLIMAWMLFWIFRF